MGSYPLREMGKRAKAKAPPKKAKPKVATIFDCPFCGKTMSCAVKMDFEHSVDTIRCEACDAKYSAQISRLSDAIDVYSEWIDMCEQVNNPDGAGETVVQGSDDDDDL